MWLVRRILIKHSVQSPLQNAVKAPSCSVLPKAPRGTYWCCFLFYMLGNWSWQALKDPPKSPCSSKRKLFVPNPLTVLHYLSTWDLPTICQPETSLDIDKGELWEWMELTSEGGWGKQRECRSRGYSRGPETPSLSQAAERNMWNLNQSASPIAEPSYWLGPHCFNCLRSHTYHKQLLSPKHRCENQISRLGGTGPQISTEQARGATDFSQAGSGMLTSEKLRLSGRKLSR